MHDALSMLQAGTAGLALGGIFFSGLWWTVKLATAATNPASWFLISLLLRMSIVLAGFYLVGGGHWGRLAASLVGFATARVLITVLSSPSARARFWPAAGISNAP